MKNITKLVIVAATVGLIVASPLGEIEKKDNIVQARYDGWASSNKIEGSYYITNDQLKHGDFSTWNSIMTASIGYLFPGGKLAGGFLGYGLSGLFKDSYFESQRISAISQGKGIYVRLRFTYKTDNYGNRVPYLTNYYYSVM